MLYRALVRPLLFLLTAETAHRLVLWVLRVLSRSPALLHAFARAPDPCLRCKLFDRELASPIGLAAGLDKDAEAYDAFAALGFGSVEVGTLTALPQPGNPRPRLFRLPEDRALVNRMGFNNCGAADAARRIAARPRGTLLGINIGKSKAATVEAALDDYAQSARLLGPLADYLVINISSPNTPGLRDLQAVDQLRPLLAKVRAVLDEVSPHRRVPLLVKIAPDLADADIDAVAELALELGLEGIVAVNTTVGRGGLATSVERVQQLGAGGLSGQPLKTRAIEVLRRLRERAGERLALISVGGVSGAQDVLERLQAGASLVQLYTALIYEGPGLVSRLNRELAALVRAQGEQGTIGAVDPSS